MNVDFHCAAGNKAPQDRPPAPHPIPRHFQQKSFSPVCALVYGLAFYNSQPETKTLYRPATFDKSHRNAFCRYENLNPSKRFFFFALQNARCNERQNKTKQSKARKKKRKRKHLFVYAVKCDSNILHYQQGPGPGRLLHTGLHFPPGQFPR